MAGRASSREWTPPDGVDDPKARPPGALVLYNSLLDEKVPFVPAAGPHSKSISWYTCGPTVYDSAHMGHARNYVTWDIVRRVIEDYFGYNVMYVMNVTDVDDKIILRARRNHLLAEYKAAGKSPSEVYAFATAALQAACKKQEGKVDAAAELVKQAAEELQSQQSGESSSGCGVPHKSASQLTRRKDDLEAALKGEQYKLDAFREAATDLATLGRGADADSVLGLAGDFVAEALDQQHGASVSDPAIFRAHAAKYEREFFEDMDALGCRRPDVLTRVSEYIAEIIDYVQKIADNGIAYEANGSVYFDTVAYRAKGHTYGKLNPWSVGTSSLASEGEANFETTEKRCPNDFALWKASKPGEPMWESPWGPGRPGWHIECSAMASSVLGPKLDIHTGGEDLRFPHHDNELAQAEAHYHTDGCRQWVNYFMHAGHLSIEGLKMSKSLKNFITIREALRTFTSRQLRLMFALVPFHKPMCYGEQSRQEMSKKEQMFRNFFQNVDVAVRANDLTHTATNWQDEDKQLAQQIQQAQQDVHEALLDSVNTAAALHKLSELVSAVNTYLKEKEDKKVPPSQLLLTKAAAYVTRILSALGIVDAPADKPGFGATQDGAVASSSAAAKYLDTLAAFRDEVRGLAKSKSEPRDVLTACDRIRDDTLVELGVRLEDKPDGKSVWKLDDPAVLKAEAAERAAAAAEAARKKLEGALDRKAKDREKFEKLLALPSVEESLADKYSKFDPATSEPTHDKDGKELDGKAKDKARKDVEKARKVREPLEKRRAEDPEFMAKLEEEIRELTAQLAALAKP